MNSHGTIYFHAPCFDGIASAVLALAYLRVPGNTVAFDLVPVGYQMRHTWSTKTLNRPSIIVDFLFHPEADVWVDHHQTAFLRKDWVSIFEDQRKTRTYIYDATAHSCAGLLWRSVDPHIRDPIYEELVQWSDKIDSASYVSPAEAIDASAPALALNLALSLEGSVSMSTQLVSLLSLNTLGDVVQMPEIRARIDEARDRSARGEKLMESSAKLNNGIIVFDIAVTSEVVNRYLPFHIFPEGRYSAGVIRGLHQFKITVMRNPWIEFQSPSLGQICARYGGGGHHRVGSIVVDDGSRAGLLLQSVLADLLASDTEVSQ